jgi:anti-sigma factor RsiW
MEIEGMTLSCRELVELVTEYLEGSLDGQRRARFEQHLAICAGCQRYLDQMRATIAAAGSLRESDLGEPERTKLLEAFRGWKSKKP